MVLIKKYRNNKIDDFIVEGETPVRWRNEAREAEVALVFPCRREGAHRWRSTSEGGGRGRVRRGRKSRMGADLLSQ